MEAGGSQREFFRFFLELRAGTQMTPWGEETKRSLGRLAEMERLHQILVPGQHIRQEEIVTQHAAGNHERLRKPEAQVVRQ
jgi:hypothetical protein